MTHFTEVNGNDFALLVPCMTRNIILENTGLRIIVFFISSHGTVEIRWQITEKFSFTFAIGRDSATNKMFE
jgi:hypothetical protein